MRERSVEIVADERRLERSIATTLRIIDAAQIERQAPPVRHARDRLTRVYRLMQLARAKERLAV